MSEEFFWWSRGESFSPAGSVRVGSDVPPGTSFTTDPFDSPLQLTQNKKKPYLQYDFFSFFVKATKKIFLLVCNKVSNSNEKSRREPCISSMRSIVYCQVRKSYYF